MIYYFSAEGNSAWVARKIAQGTKDKAISISDIKRRQLPLEPLEPGEPLGLVFPVYAWAPPTYVIEFVRTLSVHPDTYVYAVCTCGDDAGFAIKRLGENINVTSGFSLLMPNTYVLLSDVDDETVVKEKIAAARQKVKNICEVVNKREAVFDFDKGIFPRIKSYFIAPLFQMTTQDKDFYAEDTCISCNICVKVCPNQNIVLADEKPKWLGNCMHCLACLHHCPVQAIQYGKKTKRYGRYVFPASEE